MLTIRHLATTEGRASLAKGNIQLWKVTIISTCLGTLVETKIYPNKNVYYVFNPMAQLEKRGNVGMGGTAKRKKRALGLSKSLRSKIFQGCTYQMGKL